MSMIYSDPSRESLPTSLPNVEVFYQKRFYGMPAGWYWQPCFPGCLPDGDPVGPFETEAEAIADAQDCD